MIRHPLHETRGTAARVVADTSGASAIILAITLPIVIGGVGLAVDVGLWYQTERRMQSAADTAAFTAAVESRVTDGYETKALEEARFNNNFRGDDGGFALDTVTSGANRYFRVTLVEDRRDIFSGVLAGILGSDRDAGRIRVSGTAMFQVEDGYCLFALDDDAGPAIEISGNAEAALTDCGIHANSRSDQAIEIGNSPEVAAKCISAVGGIDTHQNNTLDLDCGNPRPSFPRQSDPYARLQDEQVSIPGDSETRNETSGTLKPGRYPDGLDLSGDVELEPGEYYFDKDFKATGGNISITGEDVFLYFEGDAVLNIGGNATIDISAKTEGPYAGVAMYFDPDSTFGNEHRLNGTIASSFNGAVYAPNADFRFNGTSSSKDNPPCFQLVSRTMNFSGNSTIRSDCSDSDYDISLESVALVANEDFPG